MSIIDREVRMHQPIFGPNERINDITGDEAVLAQEGIAAQGQAGMTNWDLGDNLGSTRYVINNSSAVVDHVVDNAFGQTTLETNTTVAHWDGFAGGHTDGDTGDVLNGERRYDASTGGWTTQDPIGFGGGDANPGRYAGNSPTNLVDPSGRSPQSGAGGGGVINDPALKAAYAAFIKKGGMIDGSPTPTTPQMPGAWESFKQDVVMLKYPVATIKGFGAGLTDGAAMVANAATLGNITSLNNYVDNAIAVNGGVYACANTAANVGVKAGYLAIGLGAPCSYAAMGINMMNGANGAGNMYNGYQTGNKLQMLQGALQFGGAIKGAAGNISCFVAGTQVVMAGPDSPQLAFEEWAVPTGGGTAIAPCLIAAIGVTGLTSPRRSRQDEEAEEEQAQRAAVDALFGINAGDDEEDFSSGNLDSYESPLLLDSWAGRGAARAALTAPTAAAVYEPTNVLADSAALHDRPARGTAPRGKLNGEAKRDRSNCSRVPKGRRVL